MSVCVCVCVCPCLCVDVCVHEVWEMCPLRVVVVRVCGMCGMSGDPSLLACRHSIRPVSNSVAQGGARSCVIA